jgi:uncharacterized membrane protein YfcA
LANGLIVANCFGKYLNTMTRHDPDFKHMPMINYNLAIISTPMIMVGSFFGVILNQTVPEAWLVIMLVCIITMSAVLTLDKVVDSFKQETLALERKNEGLDEPLISNSESQSGTTTPLKK